MKLMFFWIIFLLNYSFEKNIENSLLGNFDNKEYLIKNDTFLKYSTLDGYLANGGSKKYKSNGHCIYLDKLEYDKQMKEIEVEVSLYEGIFSEEKMYYKGSNEEMKPNETVGFNLSKYYNEHDEGSYTHEKLYSKYTLYFKIPKLEDKYIYITIPNATLTSEGYVEIIVNYKFPGWAIALIVIGSLAILAFIIILYYTKCFSKCCCDCCCFSQDID